VIMACYVAVWEVVFYNFMPDYLDQYTGLTRSSRRGWPARRRTPIALRRRRCGSSATCTRKQPTLNDGVYAARARCPMHRLYACGLPAFTSRRSDRPQGKTARSVVRVTRAPELACGPLCAMHP
jgi:hypothetical protein